MAGFSKLYCIGGRGGFQGADGINPIYVQILAGEGNRQWLEALYVDQSIRRLGDLRVIIPEGPDHPNALVDACIAFLPDHFRECPSLAIVERKLQGRQTLDFDQGADVPEEWTELRKEALPFFKSLHIFQADLVEMDLSQYP